ncbi:uncharacterized protein LOC103580598 [Microplitis demolitor]|uniref:uncharacterized protein LOC103580598 n=1 Tax=Microplitis demolitor TaxID=69319 RepID=UPI0004CCD3AA|nr:uncharacterized protein LOC103580598 [Microplitis demolitor]XP_014300693.1 uncharacterized protein LOC103580598 [Microplitis demolitor]XP_014300695.1 uncharacterized protein LOC103580598 [Microplitis demolitor]XP_014300698.1 uncharacterized protein LOC103580598 [Microplitis demolitor]
MQSIFKISNPLLLLIIIASSQAYNSRLTECAFPSKWEGTWFQSGVRQPILISKSFLSSKGKCLRNEGDKFLVVDEKSCYRCVVIHEKHTNVLQYKETFCHNKNSLTSLCSYITGDALLYSMFREEAIAVSCPFRGPMTFTYNRGHGTCSSPLSNVDTCTDDSRLLFRYQACPDVPASESAVEELECLALWKEGSSRYLVGRLHHGHASSNEERYRCFVYERVGQSIGGLSRTILGIDAIDQEITFPVSGPVVEGAPDIYRVAQSGDATCNGLFSPMEGSRTMTLTKVSTPGKCRFPEWLTGYANNDLTWHTLDLTRSYTFHPRNATLHITRTNSSNSWFDSSFSGSQDMIGKDEEQDIKIVCNSIKQSNPSQTVTMLVAHFTVGCQSGFVCMTFYKRDGHIMEVQTGNTASRPEEACGLSHYQSRNIPYLTLVTSSSKPQQCPYLGRFTVSGIHDNQRNTRENQHTSQNSLIVKIQEANKVRHTEDRESQKVDAETEKKRINNKYLIRERNGRKVRSNHSNRYHNNLKRVRTRRKSKIDVTDDTQYRIARSPKIEDFQMHVDTIPQVPQLRSLKSDDTLLDELHNPNEDFETNNKPLIKLFDSESISLSYHDLLRVKRSLQSNENEEFSDDPEKRGKREEDDLQCNSEITTLTIGCSTADRMEFQSDCMDDTESITAYSCHGRWFDSEGTQFVIATPLIQRTDWSNGNNEPQTFRNSPRLCFMYRENGGVVSLTASPVACQRGIPPPQPMLAFNVTSIGRCMDDSSSMSQRASYLMMITTVIILYLEILR